MQPTRAALCFFLLLKLAFGGQVQANPLGKVLDLIKDLIAEIQSDGDKAEKAYREYVEWCDKTASDTNFAIQAAETEQGTLTAKIGELASRVDVAESKIGELASSISEGEEQLKSATAIREKEAAEFGQSEKELDEAVDALTRAMKVLQREMKKGASLAQLSDSTMEELLTGLGAVINAASFTGEDKDRLSALLQAQDREEDMMGAPAAASYKSHSGGILEVLEEMKEKAETQLGNARKAELTAKNNYELLKQSLEDQLKADKSDLAEEKGAKAAAQEGGASAKGELEVTVKELGNAKKELATAQTTCITAAGDHEQTVAARNEELKTVTDALKMLQDATGDSAESFVQLSSKSSSSERSGEDVVAMVKKLAAKHHSTALAQLASRMKVAIRYGEDPFGKIKDLIERMIAKLEKEAGNEANEKAYCDKEMKETGSKKSDLEDVVATMTTKIDQSLSRTSQLKEQMQELQNEVAVITKEQAEMDQIRADQRETYLKEKADLERGLTGIRGALKVLRDYYAKDQEKSFLQQDDDNSFGAFMQQPSPPQKFEKSGGAGSGIIGILEVTESDFAKNLAKVEAEEEDEVTEHAKMTQENTVAMHSKEQDVKYKTQESKSLAKAIAELSTDRDDSSTELSAVLDFYGRLKERCIGKPDTYEERIKRRAAEIEGLREALTILEDEAAFVQRKERRERRHRRHHMRGALEAE